MARFLGTRKHGSFKAVCPAPSINKPPVGNSLVPLPCPVMHDLGNSVGVVKHVRLNGRRQGVTHYRHDPIGQLLSAVQPDLQEAFAFDPAGKLVDKREKEKEE